MSDPATGDYLDVVSPENTRRIALHPEAICCIGRANQNNLILDGDLVSRFHAVIQCTENGEYLVADLGSRNGTFVNGTRVNAPAVLASTDRIEIGGHMLTLHQESRLHRTLVEGPSDETIAGFNLRRISVMVVDIRDFTGLYSLEPAGVSEAMVAFNRETGALLKQQRAWAQKYSGDGLMALWVHDEADAKTDKLPPLILRGIIEIADVASQLQRRFKLPVPIRIGVGVDDGVAMLGNIGSEARSDHTALGDAVNRAFRLEAATRECQCDIVLGEDAYQNWRQSFPRIDFRAEHVCLKGFPGQTLVYAGGFGHLRDLMDAPLP